MSEERAEFTKICAHMTESLGFNVCSGSTVPTTPHCTPTALGAGMVNFPFVY